MEDRDILKLATEAAAAALGAIITLRAQPRWENIPELDRAQTDLTNAVFDLMKLDPPF